MQNDINILKGKKTPVKSKYKYYGDKIVVSLGLISNVREAFSEFTTGQHRAVTNFLVYLFAIIQGWK